MPGQCFIRVEAFLLTWWKCSRHQELLARAKQTEEKGTGRGSPAGGQAGSQAGRSSLEVLTKCLRMLDVTEN